MLNKRYRSVLKAFIGLLSIFALICSGTLSYAAPTKAELEEKTSALQGDVDSITNELNALGKDLEETSSKIKKKAEALETADLELAAAKLNEENYYNAMKERIKFMYEGGSLSLLQILLSSGSMAEFLNNAEYIAQISNYDRQMLAELEKIRKNVEEKENALKKEQEELTDLKNKLKRQKNALTKKLSETSGALETYQYKLKEAQAAEAAIREAKNADAATIALLAAILECEAGVSYEGMIAVGTVIMNRVGSAEFPNTIKGVIYQPGQFTPVRSGKLDDVLQNGPMSSAFKAAKAVLGGERNGSVKKCLYFWASYTGHKGIIVGDNVFW